MSRIRLTGIATAAAIGIAALPTAAHGYPAVAAQTKPTITISGSTSVYPLGTDLARTYIKKKGKVAKFKFLQGGSDVGIVDAAKGRVSIGMSSRDLQAGDPGGIVFTKIARDGVCIVTHPDNPLPNISQAQVQDIFSGQVRNWSAVTGAKVSGTIQLVSRTATSGTGDAFQNIFMGPNRRVASSASQKSTNGLVQQTVRSNKTAIGFVSFDFVAGTHPVSYKGVACNLRNAKSGQYGGTRNFWFVTRGNPKGATKKFIDFTRTSSAQNSVVAKNWVPIK